MKRPKKLLEFARRAVQWLSGTRFPLSSSTRDLRSHYVELQAADSTGRLLPVRELLQQGTRLILVGDPGSGKTTALREFAVRMSEAYIAGTSDSLPIYLSLRDAPASPTFDFYASIDLKQTDLARQQLLLLLDGLDEVAPPFRSGVLREVAHLSDQLQTSQIVLASRPSGLSPPPPSEFRYYHLESLDSTQVLDVIEKLADNKEQAAAFRHAFAASPFLEGLSGSPLLVNLIWQVFRGEGRLPEGRAELYQMACDFLLYRWDAARGIHRDRGGLSIVRINELLSSLALEALANSTYRIPAETLREHVAKCLQAHDEPQEANATVEQLLTSGLMHRDAEGGVSFLHLSFMEFYAARQLAYSADTRRVASMLAEKSSHAREVAVFAAGMVADVAPLVEAAVDRRELILAATCLREGRTENAALEAYVLDQLRRELGKDWVGKLAAASSHADSQPTESIHDELLRLLEQSRSPVHSANRRGKLFENFIERLFRQCFDIAALNVNTENGELDIILGNIATDPFWSEWGGDVPVECKNWNDTRPLKEVATFAHKVKMSRSKLGFFVSMSGFTDDAIRTLRNQVADRDAPLVVPLSGGEIETMLRNREKFDPFFRRVIRDFKHLRKW